MTPTRKVVSVLVEVPTRAELVRHGELVSKARGAAVPAVYRWRGRLWHLPARRGRPAVVWYECEEPIREGRS